MQPESQKYLDNINSTNNKISGVLHDYGSAFVFFYQNQSSSEYNSNLKNISGQIQNISSNLFAISNNIRADIESLYTENGNYNEQLNSQRDLKKELLKVLKNSENGKMAGSSMYGDTKSIYMKQYIMNWEMLLSILLVGGLIFYTFHKQPVKIIAK